MKEESKFVAKLIELKHCSLWSQKTVERERLFEGQIFTLQKPKALQIEQVVIPASLKVSLKTPGHSGPGRPSVLTPEPLAERARHEAVIVQRIVELQREGLWSKKRLPEVAEERRQFWKNVEKVSEYKQNLLLEEKQKKMLNQQLNLIVQKTEELSSQLAERMPGSTDDEETIDKEEKYVKFSSVAEEMDYLKKESEIPLEDLLHSLPPGYLDHKSQTLVDSGSDFEADEISDDDEATLDEQEENEPVKYSDINSEEYQKTAISALTSADESEPEMSNSDSESKLVEGLINETPETEIESKDVDLEAMLGINNTDDSAKERRTKLSEALELAEAFQPKGNTLAFDENQAHMMNKSRPQNADARFRLEALSQYGSLQTSYPLSWNKNCLTCEFHSKFRIPSLEKKESILVNILDIRGVVLNIVDIFSFLKRISDIRAEDSDLIYQISLDLSLKRSELGIWISEEYMNLNAILCSDSAKSIHSKSIIALEVSWVNFHINRSTYQEVNLAEFVAAFQAQIVSLKLMGIDKMSAENLMNFSIVLQSCSALCSLWLDCWRFSRKEIIEAIQVLQLCKSLENLVLRVNDHAFNDAVCGVYLHPHHYHNISVPMISMTKENFRTVDETFFLRLAEVHNCCESLCNTDSIGL
ncbi:hypothetical protein QYM36_005261 [Artemia franciscana]|uniref:Uncharacterized protein n=1 Tax=Artemia franciscana TaxID=6661 RepID=A0AA88IF32_ARTSF|nr:hypothetical protein QYM36_005261 [Artemia franciscana]